MSWPSFRFDSNNTGASPWPLAGDHSTTAKLTSSPHLGGLIWGTPIIDSQGTVYVGSTNKRFYALSSPSLEIKWEYRIQNRADSLIDSAAALNEQLGLVVVPGGDGALHALDMHTGAPRWLFHASHGATEEQHLSGVIVNSFEGNVAFSPDGTRVYAGCDNNHFYCLDARTGREIFHYETGMMIWTVPAFPTPDIVMFGSLDGNVYALDARTGAPFKSHNTGGEIKASIAALTLDQIYVANSNGTIFRLAFDPASNSFVQRWRTDLPHEIYASPAVKGDRVVVSTMGGTLAALDANTGSISWQSDIADYTTSSPIITQDDVVVLGNSMGRLIAASLASGALLAALPLTPERENINASPAHHPKHGIVVGGYDGRVYAVPPSLFLASPASLLPTYDPRLTGRTHFQDLSRGIRPHILSFRLNAFSPQNSRHPYHNAAIDPTSIRLPGLKHYTPSVSPDGKFLNLIPDDTLAAYLLLQPTTQRVTGSYYLQTKSWLRDRMLLHNDGAFDATLEIRNRPPPTASHFDSLTPSSVLRWDISGMYVSQPIVLDTYIPAAMDGQGAIAYACGFDTTAKTFKILFLPAIPDLHPHPFEVLKEPAKVVVMDAVYSGNTFHARAQSAFTFSAMGGTISFAEFRLFATLDPASLDLSDVQFYARSSCLKIKGNGQSYKFSPELVNQLCDRRLDMRVIGGAANARHNPVTRSSAPSSLPALVTLFDPLTGRTHAALGTPCAPPLPHTLVFVNDGLHHLSHPGAPPCRFPAHPPLFSSDAFFTEGLLGPFIRACCRLGIHPNGITLSSIVTTLLIPAFHLAPAPHHTLVPILFMYKWFADAVDGPVARTCNRTSSLGGLLDTSADYLFTAVAIALFLNLLLPRRFPALTTPLFLLAALAASIPWLALLAAHGPRALYDHAVFKNNDTPLAAFAYTFSENTFLVILALSVAYAYLAHRNKN